MNWSFLKVSRANIREKAKNNNKQICESFSCKVSSDKVIGRINMKIYLILSSPVGGIGRDMLCRP